ncbi:MAG: YraN family protein [Oligoflexia bacterium]|nr:YraN family protein [Oligoflexia bacterium]
MTDSKLHRGLAIEEQACRYLLISRRQEEARIIARNYRWRGGEIDIVLEENRRNGAIELVFVEVRARTGDFWVSGIESVGFRKQLRLRRSIERYLARYSGRARTVRVDILAWDGKRWEEARNVGLGGCS